MVPGASENGNAELFVLAALPGLAGLLDAAFMAANQIDDFIDLSSTRGFFLALGLGIGG